MTKTITKLLVAAALILPATAMAAQLVVLDARGGTFKPGQTIDSTKPITLKEGERLTVIGPDGRSVALKGPFSGPAMAASASASDPKLALAALISTRNARSNSVGAIRAGAVAAALPDPWLVDISRPGPRCVREGETQVWWRPDAKAAEDFSVYPVDRSWTADLGWDAGADRMEAPELAAQSSTYVVKNGSQESAITVNVIPKAIDNDMVLTAWMLEKGCTQQADAYLRVIQGKTGTN